MNTKIILIKDDITTIQADAIVNAANSSLLGGGGVDGAIHRKGGSQILEECKAIRNRQGKCATGQAVYTSAGQLPAKYVIHTVGPVWNGGGRNEPKLLADCYSNSLRLANELDVKTIAFPNISTGVYRFPKKEAAEIAIRTVLDFISKENRTVEEITFVCFDDENYLLYKELLKI
ncbi:MAG: O-acetyl-ADP-ribose deacetylase [Prevotella sp.]|jgi:O-acetyl-ADP-ribose deacetylase (regulator of RNase III)|nr:O-acetyl-ADP-ribose deacetylase [Prevotella sp.]